MTAALGADLIFDMHRTGTGLDQALDRARHIEGTRTKAGIHVYQQRQIAHIGDSAHINENVFESGNTQIRQTQRPSGNTTTREVNRLESFALGNQRVVGIDCPHNLKRLLCGQGGAKLCACGFAHGVLLL